MKRHLLHPTRFICLFICAILLCGLTAFASEPTIYQEDMKRELYPTDVQTIIEDTGRRIVKTYTLSAEENPDHIPRDSFSNDGWLYELTDITQSRTETPDVKSHTETQEINTDSNNLNDILALLSPTLEYESDGYCGLLTLDLASVKCEAAGYNNSSYTVTATREYQHLESNDLYFIPKAITENGRTLALDGVEWAAQTSINVGYSDIPDSYRAIATYKGKASQSVVTGYITTADYTGEITRAVIADTVYTAYFTGTLINPAPEEAEPSEPTPAPKTESGSVPIAPIICITVIILACAGAAVFFFLHHNVKVYNVRDDGYRVLVAKVKISAKNLVIDLTPLDGRAENRHFNLEIDRITAKGLDGQNVDVVFGSVRLPHKIAYEGNAYQIEASFNEMTIKAIY